MRYSSQPWQLHVLKMLNHGKKYWSQEKLFVGCNILRWKTCLVSGCCSTEAETGQPKHQTLISLRVWSWNPNIYSIDMGLAFYFLEDGHLLTVPFRVKEKINPLVSLFIRMYTYMGHQRMIWAWDPKINSQLLVQLSFLLDVYIILRSHFKSSHLILLF